MPVCERCGVAYLDGENHACVSTKFRPESRRQLQLDLIPIALVFMASLKVPTVGRCGFPANLHVLAAAWVAALLSTMWTSAPHPLMSVAIAAANTTLFAVTLIIASTRWKLKPRVHAALVVVWTVVFLVSWFWNVSGDSDCP